MGFNLRNVMLHILSWVVHTQMLMVLFSIPLCRSEIFPNKNEKNKERKGRENGLNL